ncbi:cingulin [Amia ocellicauda]|uniref:cingulin n=1 Tax=Amia ocellicauda TaxID=2972642 RepID=UPI003463C20A
MHSGTESGDRRGPLDYGVQIRFINDLNESGGGGGRRGAGGGGVPPSSSSSSSYGVAVRVQGIAGHPYVVLKEGEKGGSQEKMGVTRPPLANPPFYGSLPRNHSTQGLPDNPYADITSGSQPGLRRAHSQGSILDRDSDFPSEAVGPDTPHRPPGDGRSGSYGALDGGGGGRRDWERDRVVPKVDTPPESCTTPSGYSNGGGRVDNSTWGRRKQLQQHHNGSLDSFPAPPPPVSLPEEAPAHTVDRGSLAPIDRLISKFDGGGGGGQVRGRPGSRGRLSSEERRRSRSVDGHLGPGTASAEDRQMDTRAGGRVTGSPSSTSSSYSSVSRPPPAAPTTTSSPSLSSPYNAASLRRNSGSVAKVAAFGSTTTTTSYSSPLASAPAPTPAPAREWSTERTVLKETTAKVQADAPTKVTPDLLRDQGQRSDGTSEEDRSKLTIYNILREGSSESELAIRRKTSLVFEKIQGLKSGFSQAELHSAEELERKVQELQHSLTQERKKQQSGDPALKAELEDCLDENLQLQEQLDRKKNELHQTHTELTQLRMDREAAESRVRDLEDQLAGLQEELRRESDSSTERDTLQTELMTLRAELAEAGLLRQRQEEALRQRERELTALKGALKEEVSGHDREMDTLRQQYQADMDRLRSNMEEVSRSQQSVEVERQRVNTAVRSLQKQLDESSDEIAHWREQFDRAKEELRSTKQELLQARLEKEEFEEEMQELQDRLASMKGQLEQLHSTTPDPAHTDRLTQELQRCRDSLLEAQSQLEKQEAELARKGTELTSIRKNTLQQVTEHEKEIDNLRDKHHREREDLMRSLEQTKQAAVHVEGVELRGVREEAESLRDRVGHLERQVAEHRDHAQQLEEQLERLADKNSRLEAERARLQASLEQAMEVSEALETEKRSLGARLEEAQRGVARLGQEREQLAQRLQEESQQREQLRRGKSNLEEQKRLLDRALDKLNKEMDQMTAESSGSVVALQSQLDEFREKSRRELQEAQRSSKDRLGELERVQATQHALQDEVSRLKKELQVAIEERDSAALDKELLTNRLKHLEGELEAKKTSHTDRSREVRALEDKVKRLELELDEERTSAELLTERISRSRDQIDQLRSELMQERSSKQDLELDKNAMERQMKELRGRLSALEGQQRPAASLGQLESRIQELEDRLQSEEREKASLQSSLRRTERKVKELTIQLDEERQHFNDQKDQLSLKIKALKRQVDEGEGEVERLEGARRKALRELEEQQELREQLESKISVLEKEIWRKSQSQRAALDSTALSSDEEEGSYDPTAITSILTESNLQTSSC